MISKILISAFLLSSLVATQANACTNISVENVSGSFVTGNKTGMIPFKVSMFCSNPDSSNLRTRLIHSSATGNGADLKIYKDGAVSQDANKILNLKILDHTFGEFSNQEVFFSSGESKQDITLYISIPNFKQNEPGAYSGVINFDVEY